MTTHGRWPVKKFGVEVLRADCTCEIVVLDYPGDRGENCAIAAIRCLMPRMIEPMRGLCVLCLVVPVGFYAAAVSAAPLKVVGFDDMSCRAWIESKADVEQRKEYLAWIRGVLTGHNYANQSQQVAAVSGGTAENFVNRYCAERPQGDFGDAALRMTDTFSGRNATITK